MTQRLAIICVHTSPLAPMGGKKTGGMNVYIRELAQELGSRGIHVDIFTRRTSHDEPEIDYRIGENVRVIYLRAGDIAPLGPDKLFDYLPQFTARLMAFATRRSLKYDMVYSHYWLSGWVGQKLKESWGTPFVHMFHTLGQMKQRILRHESIMPDQRIRTEMQIVAWADRIIAATPAEYSQLLWLYRAKRRKISIVPPGVNVERFQAVNQSRAKADLGFEPEHKVLLFVGRIEPLKAIDSIISALQVVRETRPELLAQIRFAVVGGDPQDTRDAEMMRLQSLTRDLGLSENVLFLGAKHQTQLPLYYSAATAVVMPSDYESFGMVALEAMATGTPVIASNVGGLGYLVKDSQTGFLVPARDAHALADRIVMLVQDEQYSQTMGQRAAVMAQDYAWPKIVDLLLDIFSELSGKRTAQVI